MLNKYTTMAINSKFLLHMIYSPFRGNSSTVPDALCPAPVSFNMAKWRIPEERPEKAYCVNERNT